MKTAIRTTGDDLARSLRSLLHGMADDATSGYRRDRESREGKEGTNDERGT